MTYLVDRLAHLRRHLNHLRELRPRVSSAESLEQDLSLHNDVLFSLLVVVQLVIDIAGELNGRNGLRFDDYTHAIRNLASIKHFPREVVNGLVSLPGFRNVMIHEYVIFDLELAVVALDQLDPVERFLEIVARLEAETSRGGIP